jgi:hypothetical protein
MVRGSVTRYSYRQGSPIVHIVASSPRRGNQGPLSQPRRIDLHPVIPHLLEHVLSVLNAEECPADRGGAWVLWWSGPSDGSTLPDYPSRPAIEMRKVQGTVSHH